MTNRHYLKYRRQNDLQIPKNGLRTLKNHILDTHLGISALKYEAFAASASKFGRIHRFEAFFQQLQAES